MFRVCLLYVDKATDDFFHVCIQYHSIVSLSFPFFSFLDFWHFLRVFDRDGNGYITRDELQIAMEMMQEQVNEQQVNEMLQLADLDRDGKINYEGEKLAVCVCHKLRSSAVESSRVSRI